ncbi:type IV pilus modification protein PilV [Pseudoxanthomonas sp. 10H]|uniref:type IV pilus modification protein PilV n=1 Tax=Pseudoxanthomonas sp. 10H TaxID=3242729 RepID=UPI003558C569
MQKTTRSRAPARRAAGSLPARRAQAGVGLLEVMISVLIMGIGLLGIAAMQATALRNGQSSLERSQAVVQSYAILDVMRANRIDAIAGYYNTSGTDPQCSAAAADASQPVGQQSAQAEVNNWLGSLKRSVGVAGDSSTCGSISCVANTISGGTCTVTVQWDDSRGSTPNTNGTATETGLGGAKRRVVTVAAL